MIKKFTHRVFAFFGFELRRKKADDMKSTSAENDKTAKLKKELFESHIPYLTFEDFTDEELEIIQEVRPYTMTGPIRIVSLIRAVEYVLKNNIPGDFVECGVWKGGSMMVVAKTLQKYGLSNRTLYLYDTFEGMSEPSSEDFTFDKVPAEDLLNEVAHQKKDGHNIWCYSTEDEVRQNLISTGYNAAKIHLIKGKVEETIPNVSPKSIALLRLDTDWYESTKHELNHLYPILNPLGVLIVDDYGQWMGQKKAVDEYIEQNNLNVHLNRIDFSSRLAIKVV